MAENRENKIKMKKDTFEKDYLTVKMDTWEKIVENKVKYWF